MDGGARFVWERNMDSIASAAAGPDADPVPDGYHAPGLDGRCRRIYSHGKADAVSAVAAESRRPCHGRGGSNYFDCAKRAREFVVSGNDREMKRSGLRG